MAFQLVRVLQAKQIFRQGKFVASADPVKVPRGHVAVYVGSTQTKRFVVPVSFLSQPSFQELLSKAEEEFGFSHPNGGLTIPCNEEIFVDITSRLKK